MGLFNKFKDLVGIEDIDEEEIEEMEAEEERKSIIPDVSRPAPVMAAPQPVERPASEKPTSKTGRFTNPVKMIVIEPTGFEDSPRLVDSLKAKKPVIINLENLETDVARKVFDFLSGATYALNGNVQKVANNIFLFAPENVDIAYNMNQKMPESGTIKSPWSK